MIKVLTQTQTLTNYLLLRGGILIYTRVDKVDQAYVGEWHQNRPRECSRGDEESEMKREGQHSESRKINTQEYTSEESWQ